MATGGLCTLSLHLTSDYRSNDRRSYLKFSLRRRHWTANKTTIKERWTILLVECVYAPYRETNSPPTFIPSLQHGAQTCHVLCYRLLQRIGLLVAVALRQPTAIMVQCMRVNAIFKCRRAASFFDECSQNRRRLFSLHRRDVCAVSVLLSKHFFRYRYRIDTGGIGRYRVPDASIGLTLVIM